MIFPTDKATIEEKIQNLDISNYAKSRNYANGAVTKLSPYISRGFISTKQIFEHVLNLDLPWYKIDKFVMELAWRDYWQQIWIAKGNDIDSDLKHPQKPINSYKIPKAIINANTGIEAIDQGIIELYETGYMHNHMRMYIAAICCNVARTHWYTPAKWMYSHLLDGDWASNALSWQWVAGSNANKKYVANQENINKYFHSEQKNTFLDIEYAAFEKMEIPEVLKETVDYDLQSVLPKLENPTLENKKTLIYNYYNLDYKWHTDEENIQRVFLLERSFFQKYTSSKKSIDFAIALSKNIANVKLFIGEFSDLEKQIDTENIFFKEHPTNKHYKGTEEARDWMFGVKGYYASFFSFYKKCKKEMRSTE